jgi:hypothetical protein
VQRRRGDVRSIAYPILDGRYLFLGGVGVPPLRAAP